MLKPRKRTDEQPDGATAAVAPVDDLAAKKAKAKAHIERVKSTQSEQSRANAECGPIPLPEDPERRERYRYNLKGFCETYLLNMFMTKSGIHRPWAEFHIECFAELQDKILNGGQESMALPRGSAKTSIVMGAVIWAACFGHCKFGAVICATDGDATRFLENVKIQFEVQPLLLADFPEICVPVRHLERKTQKCKSQTFEGAHTRIEWNQDYIVLPTIYRTYANIDGPVASSSSGFRFQAVGLTGSGLRGLLAANASGQLVRPDLLVFDDPQNDESARSLLQCETRLKLISAALAMGGPGEQMTVFACVTVIREGDLADTLLNDPDWEAIRRGILTDMPTREQMVWWRQYRDIQIDSKNRRLGKEPEITFYRDNQVVMDGDIKSTWPGRFNPKTEISGIQAAMNLFYKFGSEMFASEFMNKPKPANESQIYRLDPMAVRNRLTGLPRGVVPLGYDFITIGVDIQLRILFYTIMAWKMDLTGSIIDYGYFPRQRRPEFDLQDLEFTLQSESGAIDEDVDAAASWGLVQLGQYLDTQKWHREDNLLIFPKAGQIDVNFRDSETAVGRFCRTSKNWKHIFTPAMGHAMTKTKARISEWKEHPGQNWPSKIERRECQWMETNPRDHGCRERYFDTNHWKHYVTTALSLPLHAPGSISLFGEDPDEHRQVSAHLTSHFPVDVTINGIQQTQYEQRPNTRDDLLDTVVGCAVSASKHGARLSRIMSALPAVLEPGDRRTISLPSGRTNLRRST